MNALAWNCRGLWNSRIVQELCNYVKLHHPKLVFLSETRMSASRSKNLQWKIGLKHSLAVDSDGLSGGIVLFWDESISVSLLSQGERYIDVLVHDNLRMHPGEQLLCMGSLVWKIGEICGSSYVLCVELGLVRGWF